GFPLKPLLSAGLLGKSGMAKWTAWSKLPVSLAQSLAFLIRKRPSLVVGVGGYVSGPLVLAAWGLRIPILIHEQNVLPGRTNQLLGKLADKIAVSFEESKRYFPRHKTVTTGNMVREEFCRPRERSEAWARDKFCVLVLGGSQGAHSINQAMTEALDLLADRREALHITHQTGERDYAFVENRYREKGFSADVRPFLHDMPEQYLKASLVVCRAGATTLAEVTACGKMSVLIPFPHAAHNHQKRNAQILETADAAEMIEDRELTGEALARVILGAMDEPGRVQRMEENSYRLGNRDATEKVRDLCLQLIRDHQKTISRANSAGGKSSLSCF
ncbi:MAG: undecaprenyldiphospho-muramoylpentapeptide beta-N-acetylglucosaminyltransferase, partial [Nitrospinaceae bacterium]|nr:undecaprenyldiphospho-muramoylpentapeptide beta-N-acetylglucosaminyltransferase [Nitrospinaceae bacterium]NIR57880.1 undecaprenyldiphospho-muramoylpentapeptide beta-N-acetylglucosaminyltransferase [Nitrospinaceae bacterium]NIS88339.1 undecaprenyldiphospho-muramoylpentapeptide beta-N-acetylglucosaminyltransferase [Nitrospinaceae bacterium]NIT85217.1 undecaprenyldiphospho-muramoylpentapeptide beta-N-acetylglucosaminyltransferase [Nitrospinaceae bacterium]NIU47367.1 undecaprenyldiphospho-muramo